MESSNAVGKCVSKITGKFAAKGASKTVGNYVYTSKSANGSVQYVGITNDIARRHAEHLATKGIKIDPLMKNLSR